MPDSPNSLLLSDDEGGLVELPIHSEYQLAEPVTIAAIIAFIKKYGPVIIFLKDLFSKGGGGDLGWLQKALDQINFKLDQIISKLSVATYHIEKVREKLDGVPSETVQELIKTDLAGLLIEYELVAGRLEDGQDREYYEDRLREIYGASLKLAGRFTGRGALSDFVLAPSTAMLLPLVIAAGKRSGAPNSETLDWINRFGSYVNSALDADAPRSLVAIANNRGAARTALEGRIATESTPFIKKFVRHKGKEHLYMTLKVRFVGAPENGFDYEVETLEWRKEFDPPDRGGGGGGGRGGVFGEDESIFREAPESFSINDHDIFVSGREDTTYTDVGKDTDSVDYSHQIGRSVRQTLNDLSVVWRDLRIEHEFAVALLTTSKELPDLIEAAKKSLE